MTLFKSFFVANESCSKKEYERRSAVSTAIVAANRFLRTKCTSNSIGIVVPFYSCIVLCRASTSHTSIRIIGPKLLSQFVIRFKCSPSAFAAKSIKKSFLFMNSMCRYNVASVQLQRMPHEENTCSVATVEQKIVTLESRN